MFPVGYFYISLEVKSTFLFVAKEGEKFIWLYSWKTCESLLGERRMDKEREDKIIEEENH